MCSSSSSAPPPPPDAIAALTSPILAYIPFYSRSYHHSATRVFNTTRFAVETFNMNVTVFATAMVYWHEFAAKHGCRKMNEAVLAAACVFLALKVEHYRVRADQIVESLFEVDRNAKAEEFKAWRQMLLETELVLCDTLGFDFQRTHCLGQVLKWLEDYRGKAPSTQSEEEKCLVERLKRVANTIFTFSLITPIYTKATPPQVGATIVSTVALYSGSEDAYAHLWSTHPLPDPAERDGILGVLLDGFAFMHKQTGLIRLDELIATRKKRSRREGVMGSSVGSASYEASPFVRGGDNG